MKNNTYMIKGELLTTEIVNKISMDKSVKLEVDPECVNKIILSRKILV